MHPRYSTNSGRERNLAGGPRGATIYGPKEDGTYVVELGRSGDGDELFPRRCEDPRCGAGHIGGHALASSVVPDLPKRLY
jgi:hypothetical protein